MLAKRQVADWRVWGLAAICCSTYALRDSLCWDLGGVMRREVGAIGAIGFGVGRFDERGPGVNMRRGAHGRLFSCAIMWLLVA